MQRRWACQLCFVFAFAFVIAIVGIGNVEAATLPAWAESPVGIPDSDLEWAEEYSAVVLFEEWKIDVEEGRRTGTRRRIVKILDSSGWRVAKSYLYRDTFHDYSRVKVWVRRPDGSVERYDDDDGTRWSTSTDDVFDDGELLEISPPGLSTGAVMVLEHRLAYSADIPLDYFRIQQNIPVHDLRIVLEMGKPRQGKAGWAAEARITSDDEAAAERFDTPKRWSFKRVRPKTPIAFIGTKSVDPPVQPKKMLVVNYIRPDGTQYFSTWADNAKWGLDNFSKSSRTGPLYRKTLEKIKESDDLVEAAGRASRALRYLAIALGWGGYVPRHPEVALDRSFGDCKDKANLMVSLLNDMNIEARPALVMAPADGYVPKNVPGLWFNHAIVAIPWADREAKPGMTIVRHPKLGAMRLYDPTLSTGSPYDIHPRLEHGAILVLDRSSDELLEIPGTPAEQNLHQRDHHWKISDTEIEGQTEIRLAGIHRELLRNRSDLRLEATLYSALSESMPGITDLVVDKPAIDSKEHTEYTTVVRTNYRWPLAVARFGRFRVIELALLEPLDSFPSPGKSAEDFEYHLLPSTVRERLVLVTPENHQLLGIEPVDIRNEVGRARLAITHRDGQLEILREIQILKKEVEAHEREDVLDLRRALRRINDLRLVFATPREESFRPREPAQSGQAGPPSG